jgi:hypothetical protein
MAPSVFILTLRVLSFWSDSTACRVLRAGSSSTESTSPHMTGMR